MRRLRAPTTGTGDCAWDALMAAAQGGDASAYHRLLSEVTMWLRRYYGRRVPPAMVDDTIQDALIAVHKKRHTYDPSRPFGAWLAAIARYKWIDAVRSLEAKPTEALNDDIPVPDHEEAITSAWSLEASKATGQSSALVKVNIHRGLKRLTSLLRSESC